MSIFESVKATVEEGGCVGRERSTTRPPPPQALGASLS